MTTSTPGKARIIVLGIMVFYPLAGVRYQFLHYLRGLRKLGYDVYYFEDTLYTVYDPDLNNYTTDSSGNIARLARYMQSVGFGDRWAFRDNDNRVHAYPPRSWPKSSARRRPAQRHRRPGLRTNSGWSPPRTSSRIPLPSRSVSRRASRRRSTSSTPTRTTSPSARTSASPAVPPPSCAGLAPTPARGPDLWACDRARPPTAYTNRHHLAEQEPRRRLAGEHYPWTKDIEFRST
jgi:hypothetical protein